MSKKSTVGSLKEDYRTRSGINRGNVIVSPLVREGGEGSLARPSYVSETSIQQLTIYVLNCGL